MSTSGQLSDAILDYKLETLQGGNARYVTHHIRDPDQPPFAPPRVEVWKSARRPIGSGGQGSVFLQKCMTGARDYACRAVKIVPHSGDTKQKEVRELEAMVRFSHQKYSQYFVRMIGWYFFDGNLCIAMEHLPKGDLQTYMHEGPPLREEDTRQIIGQVVHGLSIMHKGGFAHRDIKPQNVMIQQLPTPDNPSSWWVKLGDFGISKRTDRGLTTVGGPSGTLNYMAPELLDQTDSNLKIDYGATDIWAVGVMAFSMLTRLSSFRMWRREANDAQSASRTLSPNHSVSLEALDFVLRLTMHRANERPKPDEIVSHLWVARYAPKLSLPAADILDSDDSSQSSSPDSLTSPEPELTTLSTQLTRTYLGAASNGAVHERPSSEVVQTAGPESDNLTNDSLRNIDPQVHSGLIDVGGKSSSVVIQITGPVKEDHGDEAIRAIEKLIAEGADLKSINSEGRTPLHEAACYGHVEVAKRLLDLGVDIETLNANDGTPLYVAAESGQKAVVTLLTSRGANLEAQPSSKGGKTPLMGAAKEGHLDVVKHLIDQRANVAASNNVGETALHFAAAAGQAEVVKQLLDSGANIEASTVQGESALHLAAVHGQVGAIEQLLGRGAKGADMSKLDHEARTPLYAAAQAGQLEAVKVLVDRGADMSKPDLQERTPLYAAAKAGHLSAVKLLADQGADISKTSKGLWTPLYAAAHEGYLEVVRLLADRGADISKPQKGGWTPVYAAARAGFLDIVRFLADRGADISKPNKDEWTPLYAAAHEGHLEVVRLLADRGADISKPQKAGWTPVYVAARAGFLDIVRFLADRGADVSKPNKDGWTPLHAAANAGRTEMVEFLADRGTDVSESNNNGWSPMNTAAKAGHLEVVRVLADRGADISKPNNRGWSPLSSATEPGHLEIVRLLADRGADIMSQNDKGWTPLHTAAKWGHLELIRFLVDRGASIGKRNKVSSTPMQVAASNERVEVVMLLDELRITQLMKKPAFRPLVQECVDRPYVPFPPSMVDHTSWLSRTDHIGTATNTKMFARSTWKRSDDNGPGRLSWILHNGPTKKHPALAAGGEIVDTNGEFSLNSLIHVAAPPGTDGYLRRWTTTVMLRAGLSGDKKTVIARYMMRPGFDAASGQWSSSIQQDFEWRFVPVGYSEDIVKKMELYQLHGSETNDEAALAPDMSSERVVKGDIVASASVTSKSGFEFQFLQQMDDRAALLAVGTALNIWLLQSTGAYDSKKVKAFLSRGNKSAT